MTGKTFFGWVLMVVGGLAALLAGGCTIILMGTSFIDAVHHGRFATNDIMTLAPLIGGIPCLIGLGLFLLGRSLARSPDFTVNAPAAPKAEVDPAAGKGLMTGGGVIMALAGAVTAYKIGDDLLRGKPEDLEMLYLLLMGGAPFLIGLALFRAGQKKMPKKQDGKEKPE